jgi:hypothetical protein
MGDQNADFIAASQGNSAGAPPQGGSPAPAPAGGGGGQVDPQMQQQLQQLLNQAKASKTEMAPPPINRQAYRPSIGAQIGMNIVSQFMPMVGGAVQGAVKAHKEQQINDAAREMGTFMEAMHTANMQAIMEGGGDEQKVQELTKKYTTENPQVKALFEGPAGAKRMKNFAKAFSIPWDDAKGAADNVHYQGIQRAMKLQDAKAKMVQAAEKVDHKKNEMAQAKAAGGGQPPQAGGQPPPGGPPQAGGQQPPPQQGAAGQMYDQIPKHTVGGDPAQMEKVAQSMKALEDLRNHYEFKYDQDGKPFTYDKRTGQIKPIEVDGKPLPTMKVAGRSGIATVEGKPIGMYRNGKTLTPESPEWTGQDAATYKAALGAYAEAEAHKDKRVEMSAKARERAYQNSRVVSVYDPESNSIQQMSLGQMLQKPLGYYSQANSAMQVKNRQALFSEILDYSSGQLKTAIAALGDNDFSAENRAKLAVALRAENPRSAVEEFIQSTAANTLSEPQQEYVMTLVSLDESALSLRSLAGLGSGSDQLRSAIVKMLPGAGTPSKKYAERQLDLFMGEVNTIKQKSLPGLGNAGKSGSKADLFKKAMTP